MTLALTSAFRACFGPDAERLAFGYRPIWSALVLVYCVFENRFGAAGGLLPVARSLLPWFRERVARAVVLSPLHARLATAPRPTDLEPIPTPPILVAFRHHIYEVKLARYFDGSTEWILIRSDDFYTADGGEGRTNPYEYSQAPAPRSDLLLEDVLFFNAAVPPVLAALGLKQNVMVSGQDWHCAGLALTVREALLAGVLESAAVALTLHNLFDRYLPEEALAAVTDRFAAHRWPSARDGRPRNTVLARMIPLLRGPVSAVSDSFRRELTTNPIFTHYYGAHLQAILRAQGIVTTTDALFGSPTPPYSTAAVAEAKGARA